MAARGGRGARGARGAGAGGGAGAGAGAGAAGGGGFRPCIDIHAGRVKQIVGSTLRDLPEEDGGRGGAAAAPVTNFESELSSGEYARMYPLPPPLPPPCPFPAPFPFSCSASPSPSFSFH